MGMELKERHGKMKCEFCHEEIEGEGRSFNVFESAVDEEPTTYTFCSEQCEERFESEGYSPCGECGRIIAWYSGGLAQFRMYKDHAICLKCYDKE